MYITIVNAFKLRLYKKKTIYLLAKIGIITFQFSFFKCKNH